MSLFKILLILDNSKYLNKLFPYILVGMDNKKKFKKDSIYKVLRDTGLPIELIHKIKNYLSYEDWRRKNNNYLNDFYDHSFLKQLKNRTRNRLFTWPYYYL
jgi:hypothetical protein